MNRMACFLLLCLCLVACAPRGASWGVADFNKYDKNYARFPVEQLAIGQTHESLVSVLGKSFRTVESSQGVHS